MIPKLVRDKIPHVISANREFSQVIVSCPEDATGWLILKIQEELDEFKQSSNPEELIDILEAVIETWTRVTHTNFSALCQAADRKRLLKGGFDNLTILMGVSGMQDASTQPLAPEETT
jgi:predicted house-cleaning noncanonical NTP pyrophosphatase (MazG superfamily)